MRILFIAPVPPPITGQSLAVQVFKEAAEQSHDVVLVDLAKQSFNAGLSSLGRIVSILRIWWKVFLKQKDAERIYFTTSESVLGNLKDLVIFLICWRKLSQTYIHMHGGEGMKKIMNAGNWLTRANAFFLKRLRGVIVLGKTQIAIYNDYVSAERIFTVPNFALDEYFVPETLVHKKFDNTGVLRVLYLSNLVHGKGYKELLSAYKMLDPETQSRIRLDFAGGFSDSEEQRLFVADINSLPNVTFHGVVKGDEKEDLLRQAHVFCLPTYFPYEGQPISILEAYASGCCVMTTNHAGIFDVFEPGLNGFEVMKKSPSSIAACLRLLAANPQTAAQAGANNLCAANKYFRVSEHLRLMTCIVQS